MRYLVDRIPITVLRDATGVGLYVYELSKEEFCKEAKSSTAHIKKNETPTIIKRVCGFNTYTAGGEIELKDHDELLIVAYTAPSLREENIEKYIEMKDIRFFRAKIRIAPLDGKCYAIGNNIDIYVEICRHHADLNEALVFDI